LEGKNDKLISYSFVFQFEANGQSYRLEQSRKRLARQKKRTGQNWILTARASLACYCNRHHHGEDHLMSCAVASCCTCLTQKLICSQKS